MPTPDPRPTPAAPEGWFIWTGLDGATVRGTYMDAAKAYADAGFTGELKPMPAPVEVDVNDDDDATVADFIVPDDDEDDDDDDDAGPVLDPVPLTPAPRVELYSNGPRSMQQAAQQQQAQAEILERVLGTKLPTPFFALGTEMIDVGKRTFRTLAKRAEELPMFEDVAMAAVSRIRAEKRRNAILHPQAMRVVERNGTLYLGTTAPGNDRVVGLEEAGLAAIARRYNDTVVAPSEHHKFTPDELAWTLNRQLQRTSSDMPATTLRIRTGTDGEEQVFAAVGPKWPMGVDADAVLTAAVQATRGLGYRGEVSYNAEDTTLRYKALATAPSTLDARVGDVFQVFVNGRTRDNGTMSFRGGGGALRILCINCTVGTAEADDVIRRIHRGEMVDFIGAVRANIANVAEGFKVFASAWQTLRGVDVNTVELWGKTFPDVPAALDYMVKAGKLDVAVKKTVLLEHMLKGYSMEPGETLADLVNAVTRVAHTGPWGLDVRDELEEFAGRELVPVLANYATA